MLYKIRFKEGGTHASTFPEPVENVIVYDCRPSAVDHSIHGIPEDLYESYPPVVSVPLHQDNSCIQFELGCNGPVHEGGLDKVHNPLPISCLWFLLTYHRCNPPLEVFYPHLRMSCPTFGGGGARLPT